MTRFPRRLASAVAALATGLAGLAAVAPSASAATVAVSSPSCGTLAFANSGAAPAVFVTDGNQYAELAQGQTHRQAGLPAGEYVWESWNATNDALLGKGFVTVKGCTSTAPRRPVEGDLSGDGKADVLGIQAITGNLFYYRMTSTGLASGVKAGSGWNNMVYLKQVQEMEGTGGGNYLLAVRNDGNVFQYVNRGQGRFGSAKLVGTGLKGYSNFAVLPLNTSLGIGGHMLVASKNGVLYGFDVLLDQVDTANPLVLAEGWGNVSKTIALRNFDADRFADVLTIRTDGTLWFTPMNFDRRSDLVFTGSVQKGHGWQAMGIVTSPGSLDGDKLSDLVARRNDGNLYQYLDKGGYWGPATRIGQNWQKIRLLA